MKTNMETTSKRFWDYVCCCLWKRTPQEPDEIQETETLRKENLKPAIEENMEKAVIPDLGEKITTKETKPKRIWDYLCSPCWKTGPEEEPEIQISMQALTDFCQETDIPSSEPVNEESLETRELEEKVSLDLEAAEESRVISTDNETQVIDHPVPAVQESPQKMEPENKGPPDLVIPMKDPVTEESSGNDAEGVVETQVIDHPVPAVQESPQKMEPENKGPPDLVIPMKDPVTEESSGNDAEGVVETQVTDHPVPAVQESPQKMEPEKKETPDLVVSMKDAINEESSDSDTECFDETQLQLVSFQAVECAERKSYFKARLEKAIRQNKIFWMEHIYQEPTIKKSLLQRGWIQKTSYRFDSGPGDTKYFNPDRIMEKGLKLSYDVKVAFIWASDEIPYAIVEDDQILNVFENTDCFATKNGLNEHLKRLPMLTGVNANTFFPRCYYISEPKGAELFSDDFMITAAHAVLKWIARRISRPVEAEETTRNDCTSMIPFSEDFILTTLKICKICLGTSMNEDIEKEIEEIDPDWIGFVEGFYSLIHDGAEIEIPAKYADQCCHVLEKTEALLPQLDIDAGMNTWILKPAMLSRGRSISCMNRLDDIRAFVTNRQNLRITKHWVIQKYIERPLLIYGTKFDLRQFFIVTDWNPLTVWFYKKNCCRFSSQPFTLDKLDNSIHVCNQAIQKNFSNCPNRHPDLPEDNLWSTVELQEYLNMIGAEHAYEEVMLPGMKKAIYHTTQVCQDVVFNRKNSFDVYGADFMFGENFNPWLIEINFRPDTTSQAPVAKDLIESLLEDTIKVVIDRRNDPNCDIGAFELLQP